jgi:hypothetical protein
MSEFFEKNLQAFLARYPHLEAKVNAVLKQNWESEFKLKKAANGSLELWEENILTDSTDPSFAKISLNQEKPSRQIILEGFGIGSSLRYFLRSPLAETKEYFVIEPYIQRLLFAFTVADWTKEISNSAVHWLVGWSPKEAYFELFEIFKDFDRACRASATYFVKHPALGEIYKEYFQKFHDEWEKNFKTIQLFMGCPEDARLGLSNSITNRYFVEENPGVDLLKGKFKNIPAIIVSTGPSLKKSIEALKEVQNKSLLLAADASLNVLLKNGIVPHFVLSLEREGTTPFFQNLQFPAAKPKSNLVAFPLVPPETLKAYDGPKWVTYRAYDYYSYFEAFLARGTIDAVHSVAHMCLGFADYLGCSEVAFVGQDLSYDPETLASHPEGISYSEWSSSKTEEELKKEATARGEELYWLPGNLTEKVPTSSYYLLYLQEFIMMFRKSKLKITNCTAGGVRLGEIPWRPLSEHSKTWADQGDLFKKISEQEWAFVASKRIDFQPARTALQQVHSKVLKALQLAKATVSTDSVSELLRLKRELIEERAFYAFIFVQMLRPIVAVEQKWNLLFDKDERVFDKRQEILKEWFEEVESATAKTLKIFERI